MPQKVLLIDDSPALFPMVQSRLQSEPVEVHYAADGEAGIELARKLHPDLILLDVDMPGIDGFEVCRRLKIEEHLLSVPVIFMAGTTGSADKILGLELGAVDYVTKPFDAAELKARVRSALRLRHLSQLLANKARVDSVTGLWNAEYFTARLSAELSLGKRTGRAVSVVFAAVDHFKQFNAHHGPWFGDEVLRTVAGSVSRIVREQDVICRVAGPELAIICPACDVEGATALAGRLKAAIAAIKMHRHGEEVLLTASFGVAGSSALGSTSESVAAFDGAVISQAGRAAMQASKLAGRNRVSVAPLEAYRSAAPAERPQPLPHHNRRASDSPFKSSLPDSNAA